MEVASVSARRRSPSGRRRSRSSGKRDTLGILTVILADKVTDAAVMTTSAARPQVARASRFLALFPPGRCRACLSGSLSLVVLVGCVVVSSHAQSTSTATETLAYERSVMAECFAAQRLWVWQKRLNLQAWSISVVVSRAAGLKPKTVGNVHWDRDKKTAVIRVLDPADYDLPLAEMLRDIEFTVVHELIHLEMVPVLSELQRSDANRLEEEYAVNHMAEALLKLDRGSLP